jgi:DNA-binding NtrC family response regulator
MNEMILVVEDNAIVRKLLGAYLDRAGYRVLKACSAADAREKALEAALAGETIDVVIADIVLPDGGGAALVHDLQRTRPLLRALCISGYDVAVDGNFIAKPFGFDEFLAAVQRVLDGEALTTVVAVP